jgi:hypothetical protein
VNGDFTIAQLVLSGLLFYVGWFVPEGRRFGPKTSSAVRAVAILYGIGVVSVLVGRVLRG